jgi:hypothetical protein
MGLGVMGLMGWWLHSPAPGRKDWRKTILCIFLGIWLAAKIAFVEIVVPIRMSHHNAEPIAAQLRAAVPADRTLHVFHMKDEGIMFYYGRPVVRLTRLQELPPGEYAALIGQEWDEWSTIDKLESIARMQDQQGEPFFLVRAVK